MGNREALLTSLPEDSFNETEALDIYTVTATKVYLRLDERSKRRHMPFCFFRLRELFNKYDRIWVHAVPVPDSALLQGRQSALFFTEALLNNLARQAGCELIFLTHRHQPSLKSTDRLPGSADSVQCMHLATKDDARVLAEHYAHWLPKIIGVTTSFTDNHFSISLFGVPVLEMTTVVYCRELASFRLTGGLLFRRSQNPPAYFHFLADESRLYTALIHFSPALWWPLYRISQGPIHKMVMHAYRCNL
ncbi:hypothetical protein [Alteribacter keqinensis]|uniref:Uncharacterized protein n=1 Tax=Alteribacter keqinensis TaxID=2483800 RepID=A0A3M7TX15_9BACI|nr:hypothetical protein [Alteribacter keqinensis]RNA69442.1 hypothetical protein EBO34_05755 [Alteribacter keqinensis]